MTKNDSRSVLGDDDIVGRAHDGDEAAISAVLAAVRQATLRYCRAKLSSYAGGHEVAEDVTQEICIAVAAALPRYQARGAPFAAFVFAIAANKVADAQRRYARAPYLVVDELPEQVDPQLGPEQQAIVRTEVDAVLALLDQLPPRTAQIIRLRAQGHSADAVGHKVGLSPSAVRVAQHRGLARLRRLSEPLGWTHVRGAA